MKEGERRKGRDTWLYKSDKPTQVFVLNNISTSMFNTHTQRLLRQIQCSVQTVSMSIQRLLVVITVHEVCEDELGWYHRVYKQAGYKNCPSGRHQCLLTHATAGDHH